MQLVLWIRLGETNFDSKKRNEEEEKKTKAGWKVGKEEKNSRRPLNLQIQSYEAFHVIIKVFVTLQSKLPSLKPFKLIESSRGLHF